MPQISNGVWSHYTSFLITWCINQSTPVHVDICYLLYILPICVCDGALSSKNSQHYQQIVRIYKRTLSPQRCEACWLLTFHLENGMRRVTGPSPENPSFTSQPVTCNSAQTTWGFTLSIWAWAYRPCKVEMRRDSIYAAMRKLSPMLRWRFPDALGWAILL